MVAQGSNPNDPGGGDWKDHNLRQAWEKRS
jgi:hypothetical protein